MHKPKVTLLLVLSFLLVLGTFLTVSGQEKPFVERGKLEISPNVINPDPRPTDEEMHVDSYVPLVGDEEQQPTNEEMEVDRLTSKFSRMAGGAKALREAKATILSEDFETSVPPAGWDFIATHGDTTTWYQDDGDPYSGIYHADCKYDEALVPQDEWLITPSMDFTAVTSDAKVTFHWFMSYYWGVDPYDNYDLEVHAIVGNDTTLLWEEADFGTFTNWTYYEITLSLAAYVGQSDFKLGFRYVGVDGAEGSFDLITVDDNPPPTGRCCYGDPLAPSCDDVTEAECATLGGIWDGTTDCTDACPVAGPGDNCYNPFVVTLPADMPFTDAGQYTCGRGNDYAAADMCYTYGYGGGEDIVYQLDVTETVNIRVTMNPNGTTWTYWEIRTECVPPNGTCLTYYRNTGSSQYSSDTVITLDAGTYYMIVDTWPSPDCIPDFDLTIETWADPVGRCCYGDPGAPSCDDVTEAECITLGGSWDDALNCTDNPCPVAGPGDNCESPVEVKIPGDLPYQNLNQYTCGRGNDYSATCLGSYDGGEDIIYWLDVESAVDLDFTLDPKGTNYVGMAVGAECPPAATCIAYTTVGYTSATLKLLAIHLEPGSYWVMIDTWPSPDCIPDFDLTIATAAVGNPGDNCGNPLLLKIPDDIGVDGLVSSDYTCGRNNNYSNTCLGSYDGGEDIIYEIDVDASGTYTFTLDPLGTTYTGMAISDVCPLPSGTSDCIAKVTGSGSSPRSFEAALDAGIYYLMIDTWPSPNCIPAFDLYIVPDTGTPPANDLCDDVTPTTLTMGVTTTFTGDNTNATNECPEMFDDNGHAWEAFTTTGMSNVVIDYCGTSPSFDLVYVILMQGCPCGGASTFTYASSTNWDLCGGDGNVTMYFNCLPAGTYYIPVLSSHPSYPTSYSEGPYTINVIATEVNSYCAASGGCDEYIENVTVANINNTSACEGYGDFTDNIAYMAPGMSYPITITIGNSYSSDYGGVWIDWNQDFCFDLATETVTLDVSSGYGPYTGTVVVPMDAVVGSTLMRVRLTYNGTPTPCGTTSYGEAEDYTIMIGGEAPEFSTDPTEIDFGIVPEGAEGSLPLTFAVDGSMSVDFSIDIEYTGKLISTNQGNTRLSTMAPEKPPYSGPQAPPASENVTKQGGDNVGSAVPITAMPFNSTGTTAGYTNDYDAVCPYTGSTAPDVVYSYAPTEDIQLDVDMQGSGYDTKIYIYEDAVGTLVACNDDYWSDYTSALFNVDISAGHTYYIVVDGYGSGSGGYVINAVTHAPPAPFECPPSGIAESEACGDDTNGGCNMAVPAYEPINCGDTICGTVWADGGTRDTDWFLLVMNQAGPVTISAKAEFLGVIGFVDTADCALATALDPYATGGVNEIMTVTKTCGPGVYWLFISHQQYEGSPCGSGNGYWFTATCDAGEPPIYWLSVDPETGSVPGNGTLPVTVSYNTTGMDFGIYTADLIITHTGLKGTDIVPVTIEVGESGNNTITIEPAPIFALMKYTYGEDMKANIFLGGDFAGGGHVVSEINTSTVEVSGSIATMAPTSVEVLSGYEGFTGEVLKIVCGMPQFIDCYPLLWDVDNYTFTVTGEFTGGDPWT
ncbi:MAG: GEVED domain-containing protein, partial [Candidatus Zixiibacteriota bacterium]